MNISTCIPSCTIVNGRSESLSNTKTLSSPALQSALNKRVQRRSRTKVSREIISGQGKTNVPDDLQLSRRDALLTSSLSMAGALSLTGTRPELSAFASESEALPLVARGETFGQVSPLVPSSVIKGCWQLSGGHRGDKATDRTSGSAAVDDFQKFVDAGIYTFDTGPEECGYGPSEKIIGEYLRKAQNPDIQVFTKLCCIGDPVYNLKPDFVKGQMDRARGRLGVKCLDLVQFYWHDYGSPKYVDAALYLQDEVAAGRVREVALTNFDTVRMEKMWDAGVKIAANQIQYSLLDRRPENLMNEFCTAHNIALLPYGVMAGGFLSDQYLGADVGKVQVNTSSKGKYASVLRKVGSWEWLQELLRTLKSVGEKHNVSIADVATKWVVSKETVPAVIIGARNANHIDDHRRLGTFQLDEADNQAILEVLQKGKQPKGDCYGWERGMSDF